MNEFQRSDTESNDQLVDRNFPTQRAGEAYKHSGRASWFALIVAAIVGCVCAAFGGIGYCYCVTKLHLAIIEIVLLVVLCLVIGLPIGMIAHKLKIRSDIHVFALTTIAGSVALYFEWAFHPYFALGEEHRFIAWEPSEIWNWMKLLYAKGGEFSGLYAVGIWIAEIVIIYLLSLGFAIIQIEDPFCERCESWTERREGVAVFANPGINEAEILVRIDDGEYNALLELKGASRKAQNYLRLDMDMCPKCLQTCFASCVLVEHNANEKGELERTEMKLFSQIVIDQEELASLIAAGKVDEFSARL